ncbi:MAG: hypothetical protein QOD10_5841 [Mycobacterium sp.]|nr:hypothetical protein [Mycobacterium sp.]
MVRMGPTTPEELRAAFPEYLADALRGEMPPSETGLGNDTLEALENLAIAAGDGEPTDDLAAAARAAFDADLAEMRG